MTDLPRCLGIAATLSLAVLGCATEKPVAVPDIQNPVAMAAHHICSGIDKCVRPRAVNQPLEISRDMVIVRLGPSPGGFRPYLNETLGRILEAIARQD